MRSPQIILAAGSFFALTIVLQCLNKPIAKDGIDTHKLVRLQEKKDCKNGFCPLP